MKILSELEKEKLIHPPKWMNNNIMYACYTGSVSYGVSEDYSDLDIVGLCIPPIQEIFPHTKGCVFGFDMPKNGFESWSEHHIHHKNKEYDFTIYNITTYFKLCMNGNPNMIDTLYSPQNCIIQNTPIGNLIRENRDLFLSKKCWHTFKGYAFSQKADLYKQREGSRVELVEKYGFDTKAAYHLVRLIFEVEQILNEGTLDLQRSKYDLKSIRNGEWSLSDVENFFSTKEKQLEKVYNNSKLQYSPQQDKIKQLLLKCLEHHYGSIDKYVVQADKYQRAIQEIQEIMEKL